MNILIVSQYYFPEQFQINEIAPEMVRRGHAVTVLTGRPNYPNGEVFEGYEDICKEEIDGVKVIRVPLHPRKHGILHLMWNYISFAVLGKRAVKELSGNFDIVLAYQLSPVTSLYPATVYKRKYGKPILNYCLDIWPESARAHVKSEKSLIYKLIWKLSRKLYQQCDYIAVSSRPFIDYLFLKNGIAHEKMSFLPQHADSSYLNMDLTSPDNGIVDFMYAGNLGAGQWVDIIIRAAARIKDRKFIVHIVGDGSERENLEKLVKELSIDDKFIFYGNQKRDDMPAFYRKADILLLTLRGDNAVGNTMPGKLQVYMACGKPILGAINGASAEIIAEADCGLYVPAGDYVGLSQLMCEYIDDPARFRFYGAKGKLFFENHFTLKHYCDSLEILMEKLI